MNGVGDKGSFGCLAPKPETHRMTLPQTPRAPGPFLPMQGQRCLSLLCHLAFCGLRTSLDQLFSTRADFAPMGKITGHLARSGDIFGCHSGGARRGASGI